MRRTSNLCFDGERMFAVAQPKRDHGQRGSTAPIDNRFENRKALSDPDAYAPGASGSRHSAITTSTCGLSPDMGTVGARANDGGIRGKCRPAYENYEVVACRCLHSRTVAKSN